MADEMRLNAKGCPPSMCLALDPENGIRDPHMGPIGCLR